MSPWIEPDIRGKSIPTKCRAEKKRRIISLHLAAQKRCTGHCANGSSSEKIAGHIANLLSRAGEKNKREIGVSLQDVRKEFARCCTAVYCIRPITTESQSAVQNSNAPLFDAILRVSALKNCFKDRRRNCNPIVTQSERP